MLPSLTAPVLDARGLLLALDGLLVAVLACVLRSRLARAGAGAAVDAATAGADRLRLTVSPPFPRSGGPPGGVRLTLPPQFDCKGSLLP